MACALTCFVSAPAAAQGSQIGARPPAGPQAVTTLSSGADELRSSPTALDGLTVTGPVYFFLASRLAVEEVEFFLDDPTFLNAPLRIDGEAPFDLVGDEPTTGAALPFDTETLSDGPHSLVARVTFRGNAAREFRADFETENVPEPLIFSPDTVSVYADPGDVATADADLALASGLPAEFTLDDDAGWLSATPVMGQTPALITLSMDSTGLMPGVHSAVLTADSDDFPSAQLTVEFTVGSPSPCAPLPCEEILVALPLDLDFTVDHGGILDGAQVGTGFTCLDPPDGTTRYQPSLLAIDPTLGVLELTTTSGLHVLGQNDQVNTLGVGIDAPGQVAIARTTLLEPTAGSGGWEQGGLWFGVDEDNYIKFVVASAPAGSILHALMEVGGVAVSQVHDLPQDFTGTDVVLELTIDPFNGRVVARAGVDGGTPGEIGRFAPPPEFFSFDAAGIDPAIGTRSFVGVFGSHRLGPAPVVWRFQGFSIDIGLRPDSGGGIDFARSAIAVDDPTSLTWGPDDRLYATSLLGDITAVTLDPVNAVVATEEIDGLKSVWGPRMTLGIAIGPESTSTDVVLYVAHSNGSLTDGEIDSGVISRLSGPGFTVVEDVITGLPRALANHSVNSLHFGPDGRLYIAVGGNTGSGAPTMESNEFGDREEQPLSAAIVVADIFGANFDGTCQNLADPLGVPPCDVVPYATGMRNMYDFVFHSNGSLYGPDNGLGVAGAFPASSMPPCFGFASAALVSQGGQNPGPQNDALHRIEAGGYYGHPNPSRDECVFGDGTLQGVPALPNYRPPLYNLGLHSSANGIVEYPFDVGCVPLAGDLLIANYSLGDNLTRVVLTPDGLSVVADENFAQGFMNPLALCVNPAGTIFVAELGADRVTALVPRSLGCWTERTPRPDAVLDATGIVLQEELYVIGGKNSAGHVSTVERYDPLTDVWTPCAPLPGPAVENPAACAEGGLLYVFGGSTAAFTGALADAWVYDPVADAWTALPPMASGRGGPTAQAVDGKLWVMGGMDDQGASLDSVEVFDPALGSWAPAAPMTARRDNAGSFVIGSELYVVGGRTRDAGGNEPNGTLATMERYDTATSAWVPEPPMPTGRRAMTIGHLEGRIQVIGGERGPRGEAFVANEGYDPATGLWRILAPLPEARHGAAGGTIGAMYYLTGGGPVGGSSFTADTVAFEF